jgi:hypothetical protein
MAMGKTSGTRRQPLAVEAVDPLTGHKIVIHVDYDKLMACRNRGQGQIKEAAFVVPMILQDPGAVFRGLKRDADEPRRAGEEGWLCYCGVPTQAYNEDGSERAPWPGEVFLVFVNSDRVAYNWYWYACDAKDPDLPEDHGKRFQERLK